MKGQWQKTKNDPSQAFHDADAILMHLRSSAPESHKGSGGALGPGIRLLLIYQALHLCDARCVPFKSISLHRLCARITLLAPITILEAQDASLHKQSQGELHNFEIAQTAG